MRPLRVMHVICDLAGGGAERLVLDLCRHSGPGVEPLVWTVHDGGPLGPAFAAHGVEVHSAGRRRGGPGGIALARLVRAARGVDVVHTHLWAGDTWGGLAALTASRPWVRTEHNTGGESARRVAVTRALARGASAEVCVSEAASRDLPGARVIYNGVDLSRFTPVAPREGTIQRVTGIGRLTRQKGFDVLLSAAQIAGLEVELFGEGEEEADLRARGAALRGWVPDVRTALAGAELLAMPSRWEGFGLVAVEAMAAGVPVVASAVDGLVEVLGDAALLVPPEDPAALAAALGRLASDGALRSRLVAEGYRRCKRFDIRVTVEKYEGLYREVAARPRRVYHLKREYPGR